MSVPIVKEAEDIDKDGNEKVVIISRKIKLIDWSRLMTISLSNLAEYGIHKIKCKDCDCFLEYESVKNNLINEWMGKV